MAETAAAAAASGFLQYHEPDVISILVLMSFFFSLSSLGWAFQKLINAGLVGQILMGVLYGAPVGDILDIEWQQTFVTLGYIGLILIIFEGGLTIRLDLLKANFLLSLMAAALGIVTPIALCYILLLLGFGYDALETFIIGASLSTTSIGTTFIVISSSKAVDFTQTKIGTVLVSAALFDDVVGLVMVSVISNLGAIGDGGNVNIGWIIGRPIVASVAVGAISPLLAGYAVRPLYRRFAERHIIALGHEVLIFIMLAVLSAHVTICSYAGASVLFGAFLAGTFLSTLSTPTEAVASDGDHNIENPTFKNTFERYISGAQKFVLEPLFFASIGFAIPFKKLWAGTVFWRGIVFSLLMLIGKAIVGLTVPLWDLIAHRPRGKQQNASNGKSQNDHWAPATLLGMAMVARGEIGLLIIQLGFNDTDYLSQEAFLVAVWGIVLNTIFGPVSVGLLLRKCESMIASDLLWGIQIKSPDVRSTLNRETGLASQDTGVQRSA